MKKLEKGRAEEEVSVEAQADFFGSILAGPPPRLTTHFDHDQRLVNEALYAALPKKTTSSNGPQHLDQLFTSADIKRLRHHVHSRASSRSAGGADGLTWEDLKSVPDGDLLTLFNSILLSGGELPEQGKISFLLRCFTLLCSFRLDAWATDLKLIPESQNGFVKGKRTESNPFVLNTILDSYATGSKTVYVAFLDLQKAFDWVHRPSMWMKMRRNGAGGLIWD
ncbi:hypothetical protein BDY24DRAFT_341142, partial [Mrakia frigida]|uniref:uncharacterized protein n=1 Tax=Mrakia frigida TaxID=29902 RepID=UPI003FCBFE3A